MIFLKFTIRMVSYYCVIHNSKVTMFIKNVYDFTTKIHHQNSKKLNTHHTPIKFNAKSMPG